MSGGNPRNRRVCAMGATGWNVRRGRCHEETASSSERARTGIVPAMLFVLHDAQVHMIGSFTGLTRCLDRLARMAALSAVVAFATVATPSGTAGQSPLRHWTEAIDSRFAVSQPVITYTLHVDSADLSGFDVSMSVRGKRDTTLLAMATHPEYDDKYWRFVRDVRVEASGAPP